MQAIITLTIAIVSFFCGSAAISAQFEVTPNYRIELSRDGGSHPGFALEWWYVTGWLQDVSGQQRGFQVTFFRVRNPNADDNPSTFSPKQILFAHAALSDPASEKLLRGERTARAGFGLAQAAQGATDVSIEDWSLRSDGTGFIAEVSAKEFTLSLKLRSTQPILLQGDRGFSRKGPGTAASHYYSLPQLSAQGEIAIRGKKINVNGQAWFDHEWSNMYQDEHSVGWDWIGINLIDGGALMAFRMRDADEKQTWAGATQRSEKGVITFSPEQIAWVPLRHWRSPRTGVTFPIGWRVKVGQQEIVVRPMMDDQENDARGSVGILYWEGAVEALDEAGNLIGRGYLELTGYGEPVQLRD